MEKDAKIMKTWQRSEKNVVSLQQHTTRPLPSTSCGITIFVILLKTNEMSLNKFFGEKYASLDAFCRKYSYHIKQPVLIYTKDLQTDGNILLLPVYMTGLVWGAIQLMRTQSHHARRLEIYARCQWESDCAVPNGCVVPHHAPGPLLSSPPTGGKAS